MRTLRAGSSVALTTMCLAALCGALCGQAQQQAKLVANDAAAGDGFAFGVAISGNTAVCGARHDDHAGGADAGSAYVFERTGTNWTQQAFLVASDAAANDWFGYEVALDGDTAVVGSVFDSHAGGTNAGSAYVFVRSGTTWTEQAKLIASDAATSDQFGHVAISGDTIIVGAGAHDHAGLDGAGSAYVFVRSGTTWTQQAELVPSDAAVGDAFGFSVAIHGETAVVGAQSDDLGVGADAGSAYVFVRSGTTWTEQAKLVASDGSAGARFGYSAAVSGDTAILGAILDAPGGRSNAGSAYLFARSGTTWAQAAKLVASDSRAGDFFGYSVGLDGGTAIVGSYGADPGGILQAGAAYVFVNSGTTWTEFAKLVAGDSAANDQAGYRVAISSNSALVAAPYDDHAGGADAGSAYVWDLALGAASGLRDVAVLDADGDGDLDAATANHDSDDLALYTNNGTGALAAPTLLALTASDHGPEALAIGDLDNDGAGDDLAVACADSHTVVFVTDVGSATRTVVSLAAGGMHPVDVAVFDLDADPRDDVVVGLEGTPFGGGDGIAVSLDGGAFSAVTIPAPYPSKAVRLAHGDLDGDGDQDLAVLAQGGVDHILLFTGAGDGSLSFAGGIALPTGGLARGLCIDDLDGDGDLDLAVVLPTLFPTPTTDLRLYLYTASGALDPTDYTPTADFSTSGAFGIDVASGDVDDDGLSDLAVVHAGSGDVALLRGFDGAAFASTETPTVGTGPIAITAGDLNRDGGDDFVVANQASNDLSVLSFAQIALAQPYGTGCTGTGGLVPQITGIDLPVQPSATFGVQLTDAKAFAPALLLFAGDPDALALGGGCTVLVALPAASTLRFTNGLGTDAFVFGVPASPALLGLDLYFQYAVFDPAGAYLNALALSNGLRVQVGS